MQTLKSALRLAVHKLSPEKHGATLVILSQDDVSALERMIATGQLIVDQAVRPTNNSITERVNQRPLVHLMGQRDGATIISPGGDVLHVGAFFRSVERPITGKETTNKYGTRHLSAAAFSRELEGLAIVVSSDGPLTVYRRGTVVPIPKIGN